MSQSDRLFLEELCPALHKRLVDKLVEDPNTQVTEQDFQDFEVHYSIQCEGTQLILSVQYPFLAEVWQRGSEALLGQVWRGLPLKWEAEPQKGSLQIEVDAAAMGEDVALRSRCAQTLATTRMWLLIGPLIDRLRWLRDAAERGAAAAKAAAPGNAVADAAAALGTPPPLLALRVRRLETCWIVSKPDRVLVIVSVTLDDEVDVALGRAFCQEFAETGRKPADFSLPCSFSEPKDVPSDLRGLSAEAPNVGFLTLTLSDQCVRAATEERLQALARPVMTFRNFFHFHLKHAKSYLHSRLRKRLDVWHKELTRARRERRQGQELRRLATGKVFVPPPREPPAA